jgi:endonuclease-3
VTPGLFARFPNPQALAAASQEEVEQLVHSTGFFRNKAKSLIGMAQGLVARHKGDVPKDLAALVELPGVARKTANLVLGLAFGITSGVVVDTHVTRLSGLLGLSAEQDAAAIERDLMSLVPERDWIDIGSLLILHGRRVCVARRPKCGECTLADLCPSAEAAAG